MTGKILNGRYEIHQQAGSGGMAIIYAAVDLATGWDVAVKVLRKEFSNDNEFVRRFRREAQAVANLDHPNIVRVYDVGQDEGIHYIVMEFVQNVTLKEYIRQNGTLSVENSMRICLDICGALKNAHDNGVIHRDVKPHNVLVAPDGSVKITDFGIAKFADAGAPAASKPEGNVMGSVHYISPEQARGEETDEQADIYSLGVTLYEMLTGRLPYEGESTIEVARKHINEPLVAPEDINSKVPHSLSQVVVKAMAKDKSVRYASCGEFARDLMRSYSDPNGNFVDIPVVKPRPRPARQQSAQVRERDFDTGTGRTPQPPVAQPKPKPKAKKPRSRMIIVVAILVIMLGAVLTIFLMGRAAMRKQEVETTLVPYVIGDTLSKAKDKIAERNLRSQVEEVFSDTVPVNEVMEQIPEADSELEIKSTVKIKISAGPEPVIVPNLLGLTQDRAEAALNEVGLELGSVSYDYSKTANDGLVIEQKPEYGDERQPGDAVAIVINQVVEEETVPTLPIPYVVDELMEDAISQLTIAGFENIVIFEEAGDDTLKPGTVRIQEPDANSQHPTETLMKLHITEVRDKTVNYQVTFDVEATRGSEYIVALEEKNIYYVIDSGYIDYDGVKSFDLIEVYTELEMDTGNAKNKIRVYIDGAQVPIANPWVGIK